MQWNYERTGTDGSRETLPSFDVDGTITGLEHCAVFNLKAWMDEHPDVRVAGGWIKHNYYETDERKALWPHDPQTQFLQKSVKVVGELEVEDEWHVMDKNEEMMLIDELGGNILTSSIVFYDE